MNSGVSLNQLENISGKISSGPFNCQVWYRSIWVKSCAAVDCSKWSPESACQATIQALQYLHSTAQLVSHFLSAICLTRQAELNEFVIIQSLHSVSLSDQSRLFHQLILYQRTTLLLEISMIFFMATWFFPHAWIVPILMYVQLKLNGINHQCPQLTLAASGPMATTPKQVGLTFRVDAPWKHGS